MLFIFRKNFRHGRWILKKNNLFGVARADFEEQRLVFDLELGNCFVFQPGNGGCVGLGKCVETEFQNEALCLAGVGERCEIKRAVIGF